MTSRCRRMAFSMKENVTRSNVSAIDTLLKPAQSLLLAVICLLVSVVREG